MKGNERTGERRNGGKRGDSKADDITERTEERVRKLLDNILSQSGVHANIIPQKLSPPPPKKKKERKEG